MLSAGSRYWGSRADESSNYQPQKNDKKKNSENRVGRVPVLVNLHDEISRLVEIFADENDYDKIRNEKKHFRNNQRRPGKASRVGQNNLPRDLMHYGSSSNESEMYYSPPGKSKNAPRSCWDVFPHENYYENCSLNFAAQPIGSKSRDTREREKQRKNNWGAENDSYLSSCLGEPVSNSSASFVATSTTEPPSTSLGGFIMSERRRDRLDYEEMKRLKKRNETLMRDLEMSLASEKYLKKEIVKFKATIEKLQPGQFSATLSSHSRAVSLNLHDRDQSSFSGNTSRHSRLLRDSPKVRPNDLPPSFEKSTACSLLRSRETPTTSCKPAVRDLSVSCRDSVRNCPSRVFNELGWEYPNHSRRANHRAISPRCNHWAGDSRWRSLSDDGRLPQKHRCGLGSVSSGCSGLRRCHTDHGDGLSVCSGPSICVQNRPYRSVCAGEGEKRISRERRSGEISGFNDESVLNRNRFQHLKRSPILDTCARNEVQNRQSAHSDMNEQNSRLLKEQFKNLLKAQKSGQQQQQTSRGPLSSTSGSIIPQKQKSCNIDKTNDSLLSSSSQSPRVLTPSQRAAILSAQKADFLNNNDSSMCFRDTKNYDSSPFKKGGPFSNHMTSSGADVTSSADFGFKNSSVLAAYTAASAEQAKKIEDRLKLMRDYVKKLKEEKSCN